MSKRALCIGCNYPGSARPLFGSVNDALNWQRLLSEQMGFEVRTLVDQSADGAPARRPTREAVREELTWLTTASAGDVVVLTFSGHGTRSGPGASGDGLVLPGDPVSVYYCVEVQALLARLPAGCALTVVLDTCHGASAFAPCRGPARAAARHDAESWKRSTHALARPRVWPDAVSRLPPAGVVPWGEDPVHPAVTAHLFAAGRDDQTPLEANIRGQQQGVLSFCLRAALQTLSYVCTYDQLARQASAQMKDLKERYLSSLDQDVILLSGPHAPPSQVAVFDARYAHVAAHNCYQGQEARECAPRCSTTPAVEAPSHSFLL